LGRHTDAANTKNDRINPFTMQKALKNTYMLRGKVGKEDKSMLQITFILH
jgi:hypothetical protein